MRPSLVYSCLALLVASAPAQQTAELPDDLPYNVALFAGTHNSAINLGKGTLTRPQDANGGRHPSEAHGSYQYPVMDQRLSVLDQLEQGVRVLDFEVAAMSSKWTCPALVSASLPMLSSEACVEEIHLTGRCFRNCPFIVSHGSLDESIGDHLGYTFPETLFDSVATFVKANPKEIVTLMLMATHGNSFPKTSDVLRRMNASGLLQHIWNPDSGATFAGFPTLGEMRSTGRTVLVVQNYGNWGPQFHGSSVNSSDIVGADSVCAGEVPCMEGWDAVSFFQLDPSRAVLPKNPPHGSGANSTFVFAIENLSSRRGRDNHSAKYSTTAGIPALPNLLKDLPFEAGGNPAQAAMAADYSHVCALEAAWAQLLQPFATAPNWILVDFFNTTTPTVGITSRTLLPNPKEGLVRAVQDINAKRVAHWQAMQQVSGSDVVV